MFAQDKERQNMENSSPNQSSEGPAGFSDSDMSADESASVDRNRIASLVQEKRVLTVELETYKLKCKQLLEENKALRKASVNIVSFTDVSVRVSASKLPHSTSNIQCLNSLRDRAFFPKGIVKIFQKITPLFMQGY